MTDFIEQDGEFTVVAIPDSFSLVIDAGRLVGVKEGDRFKIVGAAIEIKHPISGEHLGILGESKDIVVVSDVQKRLCVCKSNRYKTEVPSMFDSAIQKNINQMVGKRVLVPLDVNENEVGLSEDIDVPISIGDKAKWLKKDDAEDVE